MTLKTLGLSKSYGARQVLSNCSIHVPQGAIYGLVGRNGAGKTTLFRIICGLQRPSAGSYELYGVADRSRSILAVRRRMGAIVEAPAVIGDLSAADNLTAYAKLLGIPGQRRIGETLRMVDLASTGSKKAKNFSLGMRQRLGIACALLGSPDFLILDEPANGLDPQGIIEIRELILRLNEERGITFLISSHILDELSRLATWYGFLDSGRIVQEISADALAEKCSHAVRIEVDPGSAIAPALDEMHLSYQIEAPGCLRVFGDLNVTDFVLKLHDKGINVHHLTQENETLEAYFLRLLGGERS